MTALDAFNNPPAVAGVVSATLTATSVPPIINLPETPEVAQPQQVVIDCGDPYNDAVPFQPQPQQAKKEGLAIPPRVYQKGDGMTAGELLNDDSEPPPGYLGPKRFLGEGHACVIVGPSGAGKSTLVLQGAVAWAIGRALFGIGNCQQKPMKIMIAQAENDQYDLRDMVKGAAHAMTLTPAELALLKNNLIILTVDDVAGEGFAIYLDSLIEAESPDIIIVDPLLSYFGDDMNDNKALGTWLRKRINLALRKEGRKHPALIFVHHTGKPDASKLTSLESALQYVGLGASELANWARAMMTLLEVQPPKGCEFGRRIFKFSVPKRGTRAGMTDDNGEFTTSCYVEWSSEGQGWVRSDYDPIAFAEEQEQQKAVIKEVKATKQVRKN